MVRELGYGAALYAGGVEQDECGRPALIAPHGTDQPRLGAERGGVQCHVGWRAAEVIAVREHVPERFAQARDDGPCHQAASPRRRWISSSGTPLVSGTIVRTQTSCSPIIPQKKRKMVPGWNAPTMRGKTVVSSAAKTQCVALPSDCPAAR